MILSRAPLTSQETCVRLACIRHAASVRPEPGSNSSLCGMDQVETCPHHGTRSDEARVHHHDSVVKVQARRADTRAGSRRIKNQGTAAHTKERRAPGDVSGLCGTSAFRERREPAPASCWVYRVSGETTAEERPAQYTTGEKGCQISKLAPIALRACERQTRARNVAYYTTPLRTCQAPFLKQPQR